MKKLLLSAIIASAAIFFTASANAQAFHGNVKVINAKQAFYYYPKANIYYNAASRQFIIPKNGMWINVNVLPGTFKIANEQRFIVYHYGNDVWRDNRAHCVTYARYRQPVIIYHPVVIKKPVVVYHAPVKTRR